LRQSAKKERSFKKASTLVPGAEKMGEWSRNEHKIPIK